MQTATLLLLLLLAQPGATGEPSAVTEALRVPTTFGPVLVTDEIPRGHYGERYPEGAYWLPGVDEGTSLVRKVIQTARRAHERGESISLETHAVGRRLVFVTDAPPFPGVFWMRVGDRHAWMAGVDKPREADLQALEEVATRLEHASSRNVAAARK